LSSGLFFKPHHRSGLPCQWMRIIGSQKILATPFLHFLFVSVFFHQNGEKSAKPNVKLIISAAIARLLT
ncbi:hypothetical protein, partial [Providencia manganoxydans]